jgi:uncharacterized membrane protein
MKTITLHLLVRFHVIIVLKEPLVVESLFLIVVTTKLNNTINFYVYEIALKTFKTTLQSKHLCQYHCTSMHILHKAC